MTSCITLRDNLNKTLSAAMDASLILTSPLYRATQTAWYTFYPEYCQRIFFGSNFGLELQPTENLQPLSDRPCDSGSAIPYLETALPFIDWGCLSDKYPEKSEECKWNKWAVDQRVVTIKNRLRKEGVDHKIVILVSHGDFLTALTGKKFATGDYRIFQFGEETIDDAETGGNLVEWDETLYKNGGSGLSPPGDFGIEDLTFPELEEEEQKEVDRKFNWKYDGIQIRHESIANVSRALKAVEKVSGWFSKKNKNGLKINVAAAKIFAHDSLNYFDPVTQFLNPFANDLGRGDGRTFRGEWQ